jgi:hypothetical protein
MSAVISLFASVWLFKQSQDGFHPFAGEVDGGKE